MIFSTKKAHFTCTVSLVCPLMVTDTDVSTGGRGVPKHKWGYKKICCRGFQCYNEQMVSLKNNINKLTSCNFAFWSTISYLAYTLQFTILFILESKVWYNFLNNKQSNNLKMNLSLKSLIWSLIPENNHFHVQSTDNVYMHLETLSVCHLNLGNNPVTNDK